MRTGAGGLRGVHQQQRAVLVGDLRDGAEVLAEALSPGVTWEMLTASVSSSIALARSSGSMRPSRAGTKRLSTCARSGRVQG